jgi:hypothetical protein
MANGVLVLNMWSDDTDFCRYIPKHNDVFFSRLTPLSSHSRISINSFPLSCAIYSHSIDESSFTPSH